MRQDNGEYKLILTQYGNLTVYKDIFEGEGQNRKFIRRDEVFFLVSVQPDGRFFSFKYGSDLIKSVKSDYKGKLESLRKQLYDKNFISEEDYITQNETALNKAILDSARNFSLSQVQSYTIDGNTTFAPYTKWLSGLGSAPKDKDLQDVILILKIEMLLRLLLKMYVVEQLIWL
jgi:hypothetical protein